MNPNLFEAKCVAFLSENYKKASHEFTVEGGLLGDEKELKYHFEAMKWDLGFSIDVNNAAEKEKYCVSFSSAKYPVVKCNTLDECFEHIKAVVYK